MRRSFSFLLSTVLSVSLLNIPLATTETERCTNSTGGGDTGGSCTFENGWCGWSNVDDDDDLQWERYTSGWNDYVYRPMAGVSAGSEAKLVSPVLCATGSELHSLRFRYFLEFVSNCRLSLYLLGSKGAADVSGARRVWVSTEGSSSSGFLTIRSLGIQCPHRHFQLMFVAQKLSNGTCGRYYNQISLDSLRYQDNPSNLPDSSVFQCHADTTGGTSAPSTTSAASTATPPTTVTTKVTMSASTPVTSGTDKQSGEGEAGEADGGLSGGAIAGIVVVIVVVIAAVVVVVVLVVCRRRKAEGWRWRWKGSLPSVVKMRRSVTHRTHYMLGAQPTNGAVPNHRQQPESDVTTNPSAPPPPSPPQTPAPSPPTYLNILPPVSPSAPFPHPHHHHHQAEPSTPSPYLEPVVQTSAACADDAVHYVNCADQPKGAGSQEQQYNVLRESGREAVDDDDHQRFLSAGGPAAGGDTYNHLASQQGVPHRHWGGRPKENRDGKFSTTSPRSYAASSPRPSATRTEHSGSIGDGSRQRSEYAHEDTYANEESYADGAGDYANQRVSSASNSQYFLAKPLGREADTSEGDPNSADTQNAPKPTATGNNEYFLAQHARSAREAEEEEEGEEKEEEDYYSYASMARQPGPDHVTQPSHELRGETPPPPTLSRSAREASAGQSGPTDPDLPRSVYSLAQRFQATPPRQHTTPAPNNDVTGSDVSRPRVRGSGPGEIGAERSPARSSRPGDYVNVKTLETEPSSTAAAWSRGRQGDRYNRLDLRNSDGRQARGPEGHRGANSHGAAPKGGQYDHLNLQGGPLLASDSAGDVSYYNTQGSGHTPR